MARAAARPWRLSGARRLERDRRPRRVLERSRRHRAPGAHNWPAARAACHGLARGQGRTGAL